MGGPAVRSGDGDRGVAIRLGRTLRVAVRGVTVGSSRSHGASDFGAVRDEVEDEPETGALDPPGLAAPGPGSDFVEERLVRPTHDLPSARREEAIHDRTEHQEGHQQERAGAPAPGPSQERAGQGDERDSDDCVEEVEAIGRS